MTQTTDRALLLIGTEDSFSKSLLMQPALRLDSYVSPPRFQAHGVELHVGAHWHVWRVYAREIMDRYRTSPQQILNPFEPSLWARDLNHSSGPKSERA